MLCDGMEEDLKLKLEHMRSLAAPNEPQEFKNPDVELLVRGSGKMVLLHKLLHKLRAEVRRAHCTPSLCGAAGAPVTVAARGPAAANVAAKGIKLVGCWSCAEP